MRLWWHDFLYAFRVLFKRPGPTFLAIIALSLSIGLTTSTFSVLNGFLFKGFPHPDGPRLYQVFASNPEKGFTHMALPQSSMEVFETDVPAFAETCAFFVGTINFSGSEQEPERVDGTYITPNFLQVVREPVLLGRAFHDMTPEEQGDAILLSYDLWERRYQKNHDIIGRQVRVNGDDKTVCGVMPEGFVFPYYSEVWTVLRPSEEEGHFAKMDLSVVGRLRDGETEEHLQEELTAAAPMLLLDGGEYRTAVNSWPFGTLPILNSAQGNQVWTWVQIAVMAGLLLIACANVANLLLGRASARGRELAIRAALGANRRRLMMQLLSESLVLALLGTVGGLLFTLWQVDVDIRSVSHEIPAWVSFSLDGRVYAFVVVLIVMVALVAGIVPAFQASRIELNEMLKDGARSSAGFRITTFTKILTIGQIAFSCALLFSAALVTRHFIEMRSVDHPFAPEQILTMRFGLFENDYPTEADRDAFVQQLVERVNGIPGVRRAAVTTWISEGTLPNPPIAFQILDPTLTEAEPGMPEMHQIPHELVSPGYFEVFSASVLEGRVFTEADNDTALPEVAVVNASFAKAFFAEGESAVGRQLSLVMGKEGMLPDLRLATIVGVISDLDVTPTLGDQVPQPLIYTPMQRETRTFLSLVALAGSGDASSLSKPIHAAIKTLDPHLPPYFERTMQAYYEKAYYPFQMIVSLFLFVGLMALFLAAVGVYSLMAFSVSLRRQEFGVRMAVGARRRNLVRMVLHEGLAQLGIGITTGLCLAFLLGLGLNRALQSAFDPDPLLLSIILGVLTLATLLALLVPLRRTARLSPMEALRHE